LLAAPSPGPAAGLHDGARGFVTQTIDEVLVVLRDPSASPEQRRVRVEAIAFERFDFDSMSRLVLARNWKKLSEEQRVAFTAEFKRHLSALYGRRLERYSEERAEVGDARPEANGDVTVKSRVVGGAAGDGVEIDYRLRPHGERWLVIDVIIENVSLLSNFRSQVQEIMSSEGPDRLIERLREKNEQHEHEKASG
jgi:phospholipid transport system substrate-binding protein